MFDYTTVGHVTADVLADGSTRAGGSAFYSALQAARLGKRALVITRGVEAEIERLLEPFRGEIELEIRSAERTTTFESAGAGASHRQRLLSWAGPIEADVAVDTQVLHLAPVARETPTRWRGRAELVGVTPQGLVRSWSPPRDEVRATPLDPALLPKRWDAAVFNELERDSCASLLRERSGGSDGAVIAITDGPAATTLRLPGGASAHVQVPAIERVVDDVGAGDVFAAALFIALRAGRPPRAAVAFANAAAAVRIGGSGADAIADRAAIEARLASVSA